MNGVSLQFRLPRRFIRLSVQGDHMLLAPSLIITACQIDELADKLAAAIDTTIPSACG